MGKNGGVYRIWVSMRKRRWWENWRIFGSSGSWVKYWGEYGRSAEVWDEEWGNVLGCGEVCESKRRCGEVCLGVGKV